MTTLARRVRELGHDVFFLCLTEAQAMVQAAVKTALADPVCRENVQRIGKAIKRRHGLKTAADLIDQILRAAVHPS